MEEVLTRRSWVKPTRKLTDEEIQDLVKNFDYEAYLEDFDDDGEPEPIYDSYGNPTRDTIAAMYESLNDLGEEITIEELFA